MIVSELIEMLQDLDGDLEVRLVTQPNWPMESRLGDVKLFSDVVPMDDEDGEAGSPGKDYVMLVEGGHVGYGHRDAF